MISEVVSFSCKHTKYLSKNIIFDFIFFDVYEHLNILNYVFVKYLYLTKT